MYTTICQIALAAGSVTDNIQKTMRAVCFSGYAPESLWLFGSFSREAPDLVDSLQTQLWKISLTNRLVPFRSDTFEEEGRGAFVNYLLNQQLVNLRKLTVLCETK
jgi:hypothetical protein